MNKVVRWIILLTGAFFLLLFENLLAEKLNGTAPGPLFRIEAFALTISGVASTWSWIEIYKRIERASRKTVTNWTVVLGLISFVLFACAVFAVIHGSLWYLPAICCIFGVFAWHNAIVVMSLPKERRAPTTSDEVEQVIDSQYWLTNENLPSAFAYLLLALTVASLRVAGVDDHFFGLPENIKSAFVLTGLICGAATFHLLISTSTFFGHSKLAYRPQRALANWLVVPRDSCQLWDNVHDSEWKELHRRRDQAMLLGGAAIVIIVCAILVALGPGWLLEPCGKCLRWTLH
jgi:hypothetical protein